MQPRLVIESLAARFVWLQLPAKPVAVSLITQQSQPPSSRLHDSEYSTCLTNIVLVKRVRGVINRGKAGEAMIIGYIMECHCELKGPG